MKKRLISFVLTICMAALLLSGCSAEVKADISAYADTEITISGVSEEDRIITPAQLAELKCVKKTVSVTTSTKKVTVTAVGPQLNTLLEYLGVEQDDIKEMIVTATDGYTKSFKGEYFITHPDIIFSLARGEDVLEEDEQPLRLVIPGAMPNNWVMGVIRIQFVLNS